MKKQVDVRRFSANSQFFHFIPPVWLWVESLPLCDVLNVVSRHGYAWHIWAWMKSFQAAMIASITTYASLGAM